VVFYLGLDPRLLSSGAGGSTPSMGYGITVDSGALAGDIASSTTNALAAFSSPAYIILGVMLAFFMLELAIGLFAAGRVTAHKEAP
jgi:hypothetical protein